MPSFKDPKKLIAHIKKDVKEAFGVAIARLDAEMDRVIVDENEFSDLGFLGQDIVDTGRLRDSKVINANPNGVTFSYDPVSPENGFHYGAAVWLGFWAFGKKYIPGRPWTIRAAINESPVVNMADELEKMGYNVKIKYDGIETWRV
jgi:hypothetical protein